MRMTASGLMKRNRATVVRTSSTDSGANSARGVPGMGVRILIGIDLTSSSRSSKAMSMRSVICSPMPMMPPEQSVMPAARASPSVSTFSAQVWVVQTCGK